MRVSSPLTRLAGVLLLVALAPGMSVLAEQRAFTWNHDDPQLEWLPCFPGFPPDCRFAVLQGNPERPNADVFLRLAPNSEVPLHWHSSAERMMLVRGEFEVTYDGQSPMVLTPGTYAYGPAGLPHSARCLDAGQCVLFIAFEEPADAPLGRPEAGVAVEPGGK